MSEEKCAILQEKMLIEKAMCMSTDMTHYGNNLHKEHEYTLLLRKCG